jgi:hypothetical protein
MRRYDIIGQCVIISGVLMASPKDIGGPSGISFAKGIFRE